MSIKILVVDDSASDRLIIKNMLLNYDVLIATNGFEAMEVIDKNKIDLVILDLNMPKMNGFEVLEKLNGDKYKDIRSIILTNYDELENEIKGLKLGAVDYIRKPLHMNSLKSRIEIHVELIENKKILEKNLFESERSKSILLSHLPGLAYRCKFDKNWTMLYVSEGCYDLTGYYSKDLINNKRISFNEIIAPEYRDLIWEKWANTVDNNKSFKHEYEIITASGEKKWVIELGQKLFRQEENEEVLEGIILDITERKRMENKLRSNSEHDSWTGLYNRSYLENLLKNDLNVKKNSNKALIDINLRDIHSLTTAYGFQYTQDLKKKITTILNSICDDNKLLFYSYENRYIFYIKDYKDQNELIDFCYFIINMLEPLLVTERVGGGLGIVEIDNTKNLTEDEILRNLLIASERAINIYDKDFGICFFDSFMGNQVAREEKLKNILSEIALGQKDQELVLEYQPIIDLKKNTVCGYEALARVKSKDLGLISPLEFIPLAEKTKLLVPLGEKIINKALMFLKRLEKNGLKDKYISINISAIQLLRSGFNETLINMIDAMEIDPKSVTLEITESVFAANYYEINRIIGLLKESGIKIAIDDFGTGYSSLARERELNINCLKIDKQFIDKLMVLDESETITRDIISMAHKLGHTVVAEGVEHQKQRDYLVNNNCDMIQGYLISRPMSEDNAVEYLLDKEMV
jgi:PAS domain S-box-containing protein